MPETGVPPHIREVNELVVKAILWRLMRVIYNPCSSYVHQYMEQLAFDDIIRQYNKIRSRQEVVAYPFTRMFCTILNINTRYHEWNITSWLANFKAPDFLKDAISLFHHLTDEQPDLETLILNSFPLIYPTVGHDSGADCVYVESFMVKWDSRLGQGSESPYWRYLRGITGDGDTPESRFVNALFYLTVTTAPIDLLDNCLPSLGNLVIQTWLQSNPNLPADYRYRKKILDLTLPQAEFVYTRDRKDATCYVVKVLQPLLYKARHLDRSYNHLTRFLDLTSWREQAKEYNLSLEGFIGFGKLSFATEAEGDNPDEKDPNQEETPDDTDTTEDTPENTDDDLTAPEELEDPSPDDPLNEDPGLVEDEAPLDLEDNNIDSPDTTSGGDDMSTVLGVFPEDILYRQRVRKYFELNQLSLTSDEVKILSLWIEKFLYLVPVDSTKSLLNLLKIDISGDNGDEFNEAD